MRLLSLSARVKVQASSNEKWFNDDNSKHCGVCECVCVWHIIQPSTSHQPLISIEYVVWMLRIHNQYSLHCLPPKYTGSKIARSLVSPLLFSSSHNIEPNSMVVWTVFQCRCRCRCRYCARVRPLFMFRIIKQTLNAFYHPNESITHSDERKWAQARITQTHDRTIDRWWSIGRTLHKQHEQGTKRHQ